MGHRCKFIYCIPVYVYIIMIIVIIIIIVIAIITIIIVSSLLYHHYHHNHHNHHHHHCYSKHIKKIQHSGANSGWTIFWYLKNLEKSRACEILERYPNCNLGYHATRSMLRLEPCRSKILNGVLDASMLSTSTWSTWRKTNIQSLTPFNNAFLQSLALTPNEKLHVPPLKNPPACNP